MAGHRTTSGCSGLPASKSISGHLAIAGGVEHFDVYGRYVHGDGTPGTTFNIENTGVNESEPDVACNLGGNQYLVVYQQQYSNAGGPYGISARHYSSAGVLTPAFPLSIPIGGQSVDRTSPVAAGGHVNFLTAWEHERFGTSWQDIRGRLTNMNTLFLPMLRE